MNGITSNEFFTWLVGSGGVIVVVSWLAERWAWYQAQTPDLKKILFIILVVLIGSGVQALQLYVPAATWALIDPWFVRVTGLIVLAAGAEGYHKLTKPV
jgi:hypothetical protein